MPTIRQQWITRIFEVLEPLKAAGVVRNVTRRRALHLSEVGAPAVHVVIGDEKRIGEDERGYTLEVPVAFKVIVSKERDAEDEADRISGEIQALIEGDLQLNRLVDQITFDSDTPFTNDATKPDGGTIVLYVVQYRRYRAMPDRAY